MIDWSKNGQDLSLIDPYWSSIELKLIDYWSEIYLNLDFNQSKSWQKIYQKMRENLPKIDQKLTKNWPKIDRKSSKPQESGGESVEKSEKCKSEFDPNWPNWSKTDLKSNFNMIDLKFN